MLLNTNQQHTFFSFIHSTREDKRPPLPPLKRLCRVRDDWLVSSNEPAQTRHETFSAVRVLQRVPRYR